MDQNEIRKIRHNIGINRETFGKLVGVSGRTIESYEQGSRLPSRAVVKLVNRLKMLHEKGALRI